MNGSDSDCTKANSDVALYDTNNSSKNHSVEHAAAERRPARRRSRSVRLPVLGSDPDHPQHHSGAAERRADDGDKPGHASRATVQRRATDHVGQQQHPNNSPTARTTAPRRFLRTASSSWRTPMAGSAQPAQTGANPFDDYVANSVTNLTASPAPTPVAGQAVTLTATVTSSIQQINTVATVSFSQTSRLLRRQAISTSKGISQLSVGRTGRRQQPPATYQSTAHVHIHRGDERTRACSRPSTAEAPTPPPHRAISGQTNTLTPTMTYGANSQTTPAAAPAATTATDQHARTPKVTRSSTGASPASSPSAQQQRHHRRQHHLRRLPPWTTGQSGPHGLLPPTPAAVNDSLGLIANQYVEVNHPVTAGNNGSVLPSCAGSPVPSATRDSERPSINGIGTGGITIDAAHPRPERVLRCQQLRHRLRTKASLARLRIDPAVRARPGGHVQRTRRQRATSSTTPGIPCSTTCRHPTTWCPSTPPWDLTSVTPTPGEHPTNVCPTIAGAYNGGGRHPTDHELLLQRHRWPARLSVRHRTVTADQCDGHRHGTAEWPRSAGPPRPNTGSASPATREPKPDLLGLHRT